MDQTGLRRTALHECHLELGAKMTPFAGWEMPVRYSGVVEEHRAVREHAGLFDVSHMGELEVSGRDAEAFLQYVTPNDVSQLDCGQAHYSALLTPEGTLIDDLLVYRLALERFLLVVNAGPRQVDFEWLEEQRSRFREVTLVDRSDETALVALQGPKSAAILQQLVQVDLTTVRYYHFVEGRIAETEALISRTGYTGEDGFELYLDPSAAARLWRLLLEQGAPEGLVPVGLAARDTLRLEAGMRLSGQDFDRTTTPYEVGLGWFVKLAKGDFIGRAELVRQKAEGLSRQLIGFELTGRGIARSGCAVLVGDQPRGRVTSATWGPTCERSVGMAMIEPPLELQPGDELKVEVRGRAIDAQVVKLPFYRRPK